MDRMDHKIPTAAFILGLAGVLPFVWGVVTLMSGSMVALSADLLGPRFTGPYVQISYGAVILTFMSGVLWGFAARSNGQLATVGYAFSVVPALWVFFMVGSGPGADLITLTAGFIAVLMLDWFFWKNGAAPAWWMSLRILLTALVCSSLILTLVLLP
jgi:hypothetical protein